jgi:NAD(P)-dependent dehydrogenase (short-subunit alcohol dehydrogenase family)
MAQYTLTDSSTLVCVITGCDTGFGAETVEELYKQGGYTVYATCLTEKAVDAYKAMDSSRIRAIQVDVTNQDDINRLRAQVEAECPQGVYCVLNNAGMLFFSLFSPNGMHAHAFFHRCSSKNPSINAIFHVSSLLNEQVSMPAVSLTLHLRTASR